jgi:hypothetical protein
MVEVNLQRPSDTEDDQLSESTIGTEAIPLRCANLFFMGVNPNQEQRGGKY